MTRDEMKRSAWVMVLNDGDTYTGLDGCWFAMTSDSEVDALNAGEDVTDLPGPHYSMQRLLEWAIAHGYFDHDIGNISA
jgi:hypothetical protein